MSLSMLHCDGEKIVNAEGKQVFLRGTNLGGWLLDELWQGFFRGGEAQWDIVTTLEGRFCLFSTVKRDMTPNSAVILSATMNL